jgi:hypothetical protein
MSVFGEEWRKCLREQYKYVKRTNDTITQESLTEVMKMVGFTEAELRELGIEATMRTEANPEDFVPDLEILNSEEPVMQQNSEPTVHAHPLECQCPACVEINLTPHDEDGQPIEVDEDDSDNPEQLRLF